MKSIYWFALALAMATSVFCIAAPANIPKLDQRVNDFTNTLSFQEWQELEHLLKSYEDTTSTQIVVLMINSLEGESIEEYANKTFEVNKIGQAKKDNGVLLVIAKQDRKVRIEVGYGLEGALTDALSSQIIQKDIIPYFKVSDNYFGGIATGVDAIIRATAGEYHVEDKGKNAPAVSVVMVFLVIIFGIFILLPMLASRRRSIMGSGGHHYYSGWGYGGSSGSFGGFGGGGGFSGGGGSSGGGGASGSW